MGTHNDHRRPVSIVRQSAMRHLRTCWVRLRQFVRRSKSEDELAAEIESNLQLHIDDNLRSGLSADEARRLALVRFGGVDAAKEAWRDRRNIPFLEVFVKDIRYSLRVLRKSP